MRRHWLQNGEVTGFWVCSVTTEVLPFFHFYVSSNEGLRRVQQSGQCSYQKSCPVKVGTAIIFSLQVDPAKNILPNAQTKYMQFCTILRIFFFLSRPVATIKLFYFVTSLSQFANALSVECLRCCVNNRKYIVSLI